MSNYNVKAGVFANLGIYYLNYNCEQLKALREAMDIRHLVLISNYNLYITFTQKSGPNSKLKRK